MSSHYNGDGCLFEEEDPDYADLRRIRKIVREIMRGEQKQ